MCLFLRDTLDGDGERNSAVTVQLAAAWKKFRDYFLILTGKDFHYIKRWNFVDISYVSSCLIHGIETWPMYEFKEYNYKVRFRQDRNQDDWA